MIRLRKNCAILGVHPSSFSPTSVQLKNQTDGAFPCQRHQKRHLEFCTAYLQTRGSGVRVCPGASPIRFLSLTDDCFQRNLGSWRNAVIEEVDLTAILLAVGGGLPGIPGVLNLRMIMHAGISAGFHSTIIRSAHSTSETKIAGLPNFAPH
jgi:hypothetical protein